MAEYNTHDLESVELSALISDYLQASHSAKAQEKRMADFKAQILAHPEIDSANAEHYRVFNKTGEVEYRIEYNARNVVKNEEVAAKIADLKAQIKALEAEYSEPAFSYFSMVEVKKKKAKTEPKK